MLVLGRRIDEVIEIADGLIEIKVLSIKSNAVCLGIKAPKDISIYRSELLVRYPELLDLADKIM